MANIAVYFVRCYNIPLPDRLPTAPGAFCKRRYEAPFINAVGGDLILVVRWGLNLEIFKDYMHKNGNKDSIIWIITGGDGPDRDKIISITLNGISAKRDVKYGFDEIRVDIKKGHEKTMLSHYPNATFFSKNSVRLYTKGTYNFLTQEKDIIVHKSGETRLSARYRPPVGDFTPRQKIKAFFKEVPYISEKITFLWKEQEALVLNPTKRYWIDEYSTENIELYKKLVDKYSANDIGSEFYRQFLYKYYDECTYGSAYDCGGIESYISSNYWNNCLDEEYLNVLNKTKG